MQRPAVSVVIPVWGQHNLTRLVPSVRSTLRSMGVEHEVVIATRPGARRARAVVDSLGAVLAIAKGSGYGEILRAGLAAATGSYVVTMDADFSHRPGYVRTMWHHRHRAEVLIGSRYVRRAYAEMPPTRRIL